MRLLPKSWTHRKDWVRLSNGARKCSCGHGSNQHDFGVCLRARCDCYNAIYWFHWVKR